MTYELYESALEVAISDAVSRIHARLRSATPWLEPRVHDWFEDIGGSLSLAERFRQPESFPMLLLPWWLEQAIRNQPDVSFQTDIVYSTMNGYLFIRLIDNTMDGDVPPRSDVLPALALFHTEFQSPYQRYFPHDHPFWETFTRQWLACADVTAKDACSQVLDRQQFAKVAAQKTSAIKIPLAAVCHRYHRTDLIEVWWRFEDLLGCWHQMSDDVRDWYNDMSHDNVTYFLSTAARRKRADESIEAWVIREGYAWAVDLIAGWMADMKLAAAEMGSPAVLSYLNLRDSNQRRQHTRLLEALPRVEHFLADLRSLGKGA